MDDCDLEDLFAAVGPIAIRRMFGGKGIMAEGVMVALVAFDTLYIKADAETEARFRDAGSQPFAYRRANRAVSVPAFWTLPDSALDDPDLAAAWARLGLEAARRSAARRAKPKGKATARGPRHAAWVPADLGVDVSATRRRPPKA